MAEVLGREDELAELRAFLEAVASGPRAVVLEGEPGIGKTAVCGVAVSLAEDLGFRILACRPSESDAQMSYSGWTDLFRDVGDGELAVLPDPQRLALEVALLRSVADSEAVDHRAVSAATLGVLRSLSRASPVLMVIDDQQWLDRQSATLVEYCARRLREERVGFLACGRPVEGRTDPLRLRTALGDERFRAASLRALPAEAIGLLLVRRLGLTLPYPTIRRIHEAVGGNPLFALEVGREMLQYPGRWAAHEIPVPTDVRELVRSRISRLGPEAREVVEVCSASARPSVTIVGSVFDPVEGRRCLTHAEEAGILVTEGDDIRFVHPLFAAAAYAGMSAGRRREVHTRLATAVPDREERARHLALGSEPPDEQVATVLEETAERTARRGAPIAAAELYEEAARFTPGDGADAIWRRSMLAADQHFLAGDHPRAIELLEKVLASMPSGRERAEALLRLGRLMWYWDLPRAAEILRDAEREEVPPAVRSEIHFWRSWVARHQMDIPGALEQARAAVRSAQESNDPVAFVLAVGVLSGMQTLAGLPVDEALLERAAELESTVRLPQPTDGARYELLGRRFNEGRRAEVLATFREMLEEARERGDEMTVTDLLVNLSSGASDVGDWDAAISYALEMYRFDVQVGYPTVVPAAHLAILEAHRGRLDVAYSYAAEALDSVRTHEEQGHGERELVALIAQGTVDLAAGRLDEAARYLGEAWDRLAGSGIGDPVTGWFIADLADALIGLGREREVEPLAEWLDGKARAAADTTGLALAARIRGLAAAARGDLSRALTELETAVEHHRRVDVPFERARTLLALGTVRRHAKRKAAARDALDAAAAVFEQLGAVPWLDRVKEELASIGGRSPSRGDLTPTEERVARLAAAGRTNREIADTLFLSVRTVESHLSHAYAKLGVRSRTELALVLEPPADST